MIELKITGNPPRSLQRAKRALRDLPNLVDEIADRQYADTMADFGIVTPDGASHPDGPAFNNLVITGALRDSIALQSGGLSATIQTSHPLARIHQSGKGRVPARPFIGMGDRHLANHRKTAENWLRSRIGG